MSKAPVRGTSWGVRGVQASLVLDRVYIGGEDDAANVGWLAEAGISHTMNCTSNLPFASVEAVLTAGGKKMEHYRVGVKDVDSAMVSRELLHGV